MNYIKELEQEKIRLSAATSAALTGIADLVEYLHTAKFHEDTTVQTADVVRRLREIQEAIYSVGFK